MTRTIEYQDRQTDTLIYLSELKHQIRYACDELADVDEGDRTSKGLADRLLRLHANQLEKVNESLELLDRGRYLGRPMSKRLDELRRKLVGAIADTPLGSGETRSEIEIIEAPVLSAFNDAITVETADPTRGELEQMKSELLELLNQAKND
ncbi:MAG: hypothetical protein AAGI92_01365 [Pseudomonadota bacterium]